MNDYLKMLEIETVLRQKLAIAINALNETCDMYSEKTCCGEIAREALKKIKELKE